jgi:hypothetical protein
MAQSTQGSAARGWSTKQLAWTCVVSLAVGAIVTYQAGFNWVGNWETGEQVQQKLAVSACVRDFLLQPDRGVIHTALKDTDSSQQRRKLLQDHKLASDRGVADACGDQIRIFDATVFPSA